MVTYPTFTRAAHDLEGTPKSLTSDIQTFGGLAAVPDLRKIGFLDHRMIVSRKRTQNLFDLTSLWKKLVLTRYKHKVSDHPDMIIDTGNDQDSKDFDLNQHVIEGPRHVFEWNLLLEHGVHIQDGSPTHPWHGLYQSDSDS